MAPAPLVWLLQLATLFHLTILLAGQHLGVTKCNITCGKMTSKIHVNRLIHYRQNQESCGKRAIILETKQHRFFCADPKEKWVQEAMEHLDALSRDDGTFEKLIEATPANRGAPQPVPPEPNTDTAGGNSTLEMTASSQEARRPMGTSPELPAETTGSSGTRSPPPSKAQDEGPPAGPRGSELPNTVAVTVALGSTPVTWQSSVAHQPGSDRWAERGASEPPSPRTPSTETPSPQAPSTETPSPGTPSPQAPTISPPAPEENAESEGQPVWAKEQSPSPETSLGPDELAPLSAHTDAFQDWGPGSVAHTSAGPSSSEGAPSREPVASGSWAPRAEEPVHATADPQRLGVLITPVPDSQAATRRQAVGLLAFLGLLFCLGVAMFAYQSLQGCPRKMAGEMVEGLRYVPRSCGSNSYVLVPV